MDSIPISKFKATCTAVISRVQASRSRIVITKRGKPVVEIVPHMPSPTSKKRLGYMAGTARILGDLVHFSDESMIGMGEAASPQGKQRSRP